MHDRLRPSALARLLSETMAPDPDIPKLPKPLTAEAQRCLDRFMRDHPNAVVLKVKKRKLTPLEFARFKQERGL